MTSATPARQRPPIDVADFLSPASFLAPSYVVPSAWLEHAPFAFWLIEQLQPRRVLELGASSGFSYFALCQGVRNAKARAMCLAVDNWLGDEHAGFYGEDVFEAVDAYNRANYAGFSRLLRLPFDEALAHVEAGSIDLLHIDGRHFYDDVKHDFEAWAAKLSDRAVVLFHDTRVEERQFGVKRMWREIQCGFPAFEFEHGFGLGVLGYGRTQREGMARFFALAQDPDAAAAVRAAYERLGGAVGAACELRLATTRAAALAAASAEMAARCESLIAEVAMLRKFNASLSASVTRLTEKLEDASCRGS